VVVPQWEALFDEVIEEQAGHPAFAGAAADA
jgi:hypothetical protein